MRIEKNFQIDIYDDGIENIENINYYYLLYEDLVYDYCKDKIIIFNDEISKLPYIEADLGNVNGNCIEKVYIKTSQDFSVITTNYDKFITILGNENLSILAADVKLPSFKSIPELDLYSSSSILYRVVYNESSVIYIRRKLLANAFRFKVADTWFKIVNDTLTEAEQPTQNFDANTVYGFCIINGEEIEPISEAGTIY